jgi:Yip1 domain
MLFGCHTVHSDEHCAHMVRALLLIFDPSATWEKIETTKHSVSRVLFLYLLPIMLVAFAVEGWMLLQFGMLRGRVVERLVRPTPELVLRFEVAQFVLGLAICFGGAWLFRKIGESFYRRHSYTECFVALGYSLGPYFLARMLDGWPDLNTWIAWGVGALLAVSLLYRGIPRLMKPDPSNALGLYLLCSLLLLIITGLAHFVATLVLEQRILQSGFRLPI